MKLILKTFIVILVVIYQIDESRANVCGVNRFEVLTKLDQLVEAIQLNDFAIQKTEIENRISDLEERVKTTPISIVASKLTHKHLVI